MPENPLVGPRPDLKIFAIGRSRLLAEDLCALGGATLLPLQEESFADGEIQIKPLLPLRLPDPEEEVVILHTLGFELPKSPGEKIWELLMLASLLKDEGCERLTALLPYLAYSRSDQRKEPLDPLSLRYLAQLCEAAGFKRILTLDVHNPGAFENAFRCSSVNLEAAPLFCEYIKAQGLGEGSLVVMSPDLGGVKRAERFSRRLQAVLSRRPAAPKVSLAIAEKYREKEGLRGQALVGEVKDAHVLIYDDMISTGKTVLKAADLARSHGARSVRVLACHGIFSQEPEKLLSSPLLDQIIVTNSNPFLGGIQGREFKKLQVLSCAPLLAQGLGLMPTSWEIT